MTLTVQPTAPSSWPSWPQQQHGREYGMTDPNMMPYEPRHANQGPLPRPPLSPQYYSNTPFSAAPMPTMAAPHYQHQPVQYGGYNPFPPSPAMEFKQDPSSPYEERPQLPLHSVEASLSSSQVANPCSPSMQGSRSSSVQSETHMSLTSTRKSLPASSRKSPRVISTNIPISEEVRVDFNTGVDTLMKAIQAQVDPETIVKTVESEGQPGSALEVKAERDVDAGSSPQPVPLPMSRVGSEKPQIRKRYMCAILGCSKTFSQKTHLETHRRAHTGEKPYVCKIPGCERAFSQHGNLTTHMRRHTGEKPFHCDQCGRPFAQRGNLKSHTKTHNKIKPFVCKLDNCYKTFTERGNLKCHQNKFHLETLTNLTKKFATMTNYDAVSKEEKELLLYFAEIFKNSNKGIKGRGKHRKVGCITQMTPPPTTAMMAAPYSPVHGLPQPYAPHQMHHNLPYYGFSHSAAYGMNRPGMMDVHGQYHTMFDADVASVSSSVSGPLYEEDHGRELTFGERMY